MPRNPRTIKNGRVSTLIFHTRRLRFRGPSIIYRFDSDLNPFRSYVSQIFTHSAPVFNAVLSSSAARLSDEKPQLKIVGLQYQSQALRCIAESLKQGKEVPEDTLFEIFLLGLSTTWHDGKDIGLAHFHAAQRAISSNLISWKGDNQSMIGFFKPALIYWEMAVSLVSDDVELSPDSQGTFGNKAKITAQDVSKLKEVRVVPHPWTGISSTVQIIFSRAAKVTRSLRFIESLTDADLLQYQRLSEHAEKLEFALWSLALPSILEIDDSGDPNTPAYHHVLLAEAYILAALYQVYYKFPHILGHRREELFASISPQLCPESNPVALWYNSLPGNASDKTLLRSLGLEILDRLRQIPITSGTRSVQAILIFVAAGSLEMPSPFTLLRPNLVDGQPEALEVALELDCKRTMDVRNFTIFRLSSLRKLVHSRPVDLMLQVIKEMYRRLEFGQEVFWIDVIQEMGCETMLG
ncbi:hypothetical protein G7046_g8329 [Stylonectria norvegica]|nr:hypothetical protein G7046_g8329 [Stylonectria norvegica]